MLIRIVNGSSSADYECSHIVKTETDEFLEIELRGVDEHTPPRLRLPDDGDVIYQMNNQGQRQHVYRFTRPHAKETT